MSFESCLTALTRVFAGVVEATVAATVLALLVALVQACCRRRLPPVWGYALWLLVVARLLLPAVPPSPWSCLSLRAASPLLVNIQTRPRATCSPPLRPGEGRGEGEATIAAAAREVPPAAPIQISPPGGSGALLESAHHPNPRTLAVLAWLAGTVVYLLIIGRQHRRLARSLKLQKPLTDPALLALIEEARATMNAPGRFVAIESSQVSAPALFGLRAPVLLLPAGLLRSLAPAELRLVLLHEMAHLKHRDPLMNGLFILAQALHWFNPAVWLALRRVRAERELYCDAVVLSKLDAAERHAYGHTLLRVCEFIARPVVNPHLVPILCRKPNLHRRILMLTQYQPASRWAAVAALALALALGAFTFTSAAQKTAAPSAPATPPGKGAPEAASAKQPTPRELYSKMLDKRLMEQQEKVSFILDKLNGLKDKFGIIDSEEAGANPSATRAADSLARLEALRIEAYGEYTRLNALYQSLTNLSRTDLRKAIATAVPDPVLNSLMDRANTAEQKLAEMLQQQAAEHPEVKSVSKVLAQINLQMESRIDGILAGLKAKLESERARGLEFQRQTEETKRRQLQSDFERRPYEEVKRELQRQQKIRDQLELLLLQQEVNALSAKPQ